MKVGDRVVFEGWGEHDPYSNLRPGTEGTITLIDDAGTLHVKWDDGGNLGLVVKRPPWLPPGQPFRPDRYRALEATT